MVDLHACGDCPTKVIIERLIFVAIPVLSCITKGHCNLEVVQCPSIPVVRSQDK